MAASPYILRDPALAGLAAGLAEEAARHRLLGPLLLSVCAVLERWFARLDHLLYRYRTG